MYLACDICRLPGDIPAWTHRATGSHASSGPWRRPHGRCRSRLFQLPTAAADPRPDVEIVFARGTTEPPGVGGVGQAFVDSLRSQLSGRSVWVYAVDYPASRDFDSSAPAGATNASTHIQSMAANCPNSRMVLSRYARRGGDRFIHHGNAIACRRSCRSRRALRGLYDVNSAVTHKPDIGLELGFT